MRSVTLYVCGLGYSTVSLDGKDLNTLITAPWTNNKFVNGFSALNVTKQVLQKSLFAGEDMEVSQSAELVVSLGYGWRNRTAFTIHDGDNTTDGAFPRMLRAAAVVEYVEEDAGGLGFKSLKKAVLARTTDGESGSWEA